MTISYRPFRNSDPPRLVSLWHASGLGRGAAAGFSYDALEVLNFSQPYFDSAGLILACDGERVVGAVHAGFGANGDRTRLSYDRGVICLLIVHPDYRRRGIGRELAARAEAYLQERGAAEVFAGPAEPLDPFCFGLYGGTRPSGFLESDPLAAPFLRAAGYQPQARHAVYQRDISVQSDPVSMRLIGVRRKTKLAMAPQPDGRPWWWWTRFGRLDTIRFLLTPKGGGPSLAAVTAVGLDLYMAKWQARAIGLADLEVPTDERRQGYAQALVLEVCRRMRDEMVTLVEAHAPESNPAAAALLESAGFQRVDTGIVYRRASEASVPPDVTP